MAIGISTVVLFLDYTMFIFAFAAASEGEEAAFSGGLLGIALGLVPAVFLCLAAMSQRLHAVRWVAAASGLWVAVGAPIALLDLPSGLVAGYGAGAIVAFRRDDEHSVKFRAAAVAICTLYVLVLGRIIPEAALMVGAVLPFLAVGFADSISERTVAADPAVTP
jgi:hypothetical protein